MGNANVKEGENSNGGGLPPPPPVRLNGDPRFLASAAVGCPRRLSDERMGTSPPESPNRSQSPVLFTPQIPIAPLQRSVDTPTVFSHSWMNDSHPPSSAPLEKGIPTLITWSHGGNEVLVEGSWDNWTTRKPLQRLGKDHAILLVLPSGVYYYKFIVNGEWRHIPDLPLMTNELGQAVNILDVNDYVPENPQGISEFEAPPSPDHSYSHPYPVDEDFAKEPPLLPSQLHFTVLGSQNPEGASVKPQHVILNHLFIEKGWASESLVALGLTHRIQSKYVTVVLYKPMRKQ